MTLVLGDDLAAKNQVLSYPPSARGAEGDTLHGVFVPDPYRWLEQADSPATREWITAQNALTNQFLGGLRERETIARRLRELWNFERYSLPTQEGGIYFYTRNDGLQNQNVLYTTGDPSSAGTVLLDPNTLSKDGTVSLVGYVPSPDGRYLAYGLASGGSDWTEWRVRELASGKDLPEVLRWIKFAAPSWARDSSGFYYGRYAEPAPGQALAAANYFQRLYFHQLATAQDRDSLIYERPDQKEWGFAPRVTEDGDYLVIQVWQGTSRKNRVFLKSLRAPTRPVRELLPNADALYVFVANQGERFWFRTDRDAPRGKLIAIDLAKPAPEQWRTLVPETAETLESVEAVGGRFLLRYLRDAYSVVFVHSLDGTRQSELALPGLGSAGGFRGRLADQETYYSYTSFARPATIYRLDPRSGRSTIWRAPKLAFDPAEYLTRQVFVESRDGTRVPMFISHRKGLAIDGKRPTFLYGYGGFNISLTPWFSVSQLAWMERGGVLAVPNLRGGGEYGRQWHEAGSKLKKQNTFDDAVAAAEWLIREGYTQPAHLGIGGGSNGGLLVGAVVNQRPELFAAALPQVGVMDMLRFHRYTIGWAWTSDYGSPDNADEFRVLLTYSPLHNLRHNRAYPATLISTGDHDDRVVPAHSFKYAASLQAAQAGPAPALIRIETRAGHGAGKPTELLIKEAADRLSFMDHVLSGGATR
ncbi:MAG: S9 family peptidase [Betaproteobacteria bacterium]|nr:S9 family peptidase [Betaproteobacteria bacterium]